MTRFLTVLVSALLVFGLSFPAPALAAGESPLGAAQSSGLMAAENGGRVWYVAPAPVGSDAEGVPGTEEEPFATISHAISKMQGGDTVLVHGGTYRDEIANVPSGSAGNPSTIRACDGEEVWLTGGEPIAGWKRTEENGDIWVADMDWDMRDITEFDAMGYLRDSNNKGEAKAIRYDNIVFASGSLAPEGRWPNAAVDQFLDRGRYAVTDAATNARELVDDALPGDVDFTGGHAWIAAGNGYLSISASVTRHDRTAGKLGIKSDSSAGEYTYTYNPTKGDYYFITKCLATLDAEGEWYKDKDAGKLYLFSKSDPNELGVEAQKRTHVVRIGYGEDGEGDVTYEDASYITVSGINARLGSVAFSPVASHCTFEQATIQSPDHKASSHTYGLSEGVRVDGTDNLLARCEIENTYGAAVLLRGARNRVVNNHIHDTNFEHGQTDAAVRVKGREHLVSHNSVHHCMRGALGGEFEACEICYNDLYDCMRVSRDGGVVYFNWHDYENSEFHHNWLHDTLDFPDDHIQVGLYLDSFTSSFVVYRNVVWGIQKHDPNNAQVDNNGKHLTYQLDPNSLNNVFVNNTFVNWRPTHMNFYPNQDCSGTVFINNIYQSMSWIDDGDHYYPWNWRSKYDPVTKKSVRVERDMLNEMGALFDAGHNIEGDFRDNTWPARTDLGWTDPANNDYTLTAASAVIDKGRVVEGIADTFKGDAPDLGAYEYGDDWKPGCDLDSDIDDTYALHAQIPYRNLLANRGFETQDPNRQSDIAYTDFDQWKEIGTPQRVGRMSSWGHWGWVVKQGSSCAVLDSDGEALTQHVSGLKPNTTYRMGGYGFVAGAFTRPSDLTSAMTRDGESVSNSTLGSLRGKSPLSLVGLGQLEFADVNFGLGRDRIVLGLNGPKVGQVISVALGNASNVVASYDVPNNLSTSETGWRWVTLELVKTYKGRQDVFIVLGGDNSNLSFAGFITDTATSGEMLSMTASAPDIGKAGSVRVSSWFKPFEGSYYAPHSGIVKTGASGELDFTISKRGGDLVGYVDEVFLAELPDGKNFGINTQTAPAAQTIVVGGADATGAEDATQAILDALEKASGGDTVELPAGTFLVSRELELPEGVTLCGAGAEETTLASSTPYALALRQDGAAVRDLRVERAGLRVSSCAGASVVDVAVARTPFHGLEIANAKNLTVSGLTVHEYAIDDANHAAISLAGDGAGSTVSAAIVGTEEGGTRANSAINVYGSGYDLSGVSVNSFQSFDVLFSGDSSGNTLHTAVPLSIYCGAAFDANDIVVEGVARMDVYDSIPNWNRRFFTEYVLDVRRYDAASDKGALSRMDACKDGFERVMTINAVGGDAHLDSGPVDVEGSIQWKDDRVVSQGGSEVVALVCQDGVWREAELEGACREYATVGEMKAAASELKAGDTAVTERYGDDKPEPSGATYRIIWGSGNLVENGRYIQLGDSGLWAVLQVPASGEVDLYQFGCAGDGVTDDKARVNAAFHSGASTVHVSAGTYQVEGVSIPSGTTIVGTSRDECVFAPPLDARGYGNPVDGFVGLEAAASDVAVRNVTFDGRRNVYEKAGVELADDTPAWPNAAHDLFGDLGLKHFTLFGWLYGATNVTIDGCRFENNNHEAIQFAGGEDITVTDSEFLDVDCGFISQGGDERGNVTNVRVDGCTFEGHWFSEPISMFAEGSHYEKLAFTNNTFRNKPAGSAILLFANDSDQQNTFHDVTISGNKMQRCSGGLSIWNVTDGVFSDNDLGDSRISLNDCENVKVSGASFADVPQSPLLMRGCTDVHVEGLDVDGFGSALDGEGKFVFPAISVGSNVPGGQNENCSISGTVRSKFTSTAENRQVGTIATVGGVDLSGITFDLPGFAYALFVHSGVTGLTYCTGQDVLVYDGSGNLGNDIVVDAAADVTIDVATSDGGTTFTDTRLASAFERHHTTWHATWCNWAAGTSLAYMDSCQDGFVRTLVVDVPEGSSGARLSDGDGSDGSIAWLGGGHELGTGASQVYRLVCVDGVWHELDVGVSYVWSGDFSSVSAVSTSGEAVVAPQAETVATNMEVTKPATCEEAGEVTYTATFSNPAFEEQSKTVASLPALGHAWDAGTVTTKPTTAKPGVRTYTCTRCKAVRTDAVPKLDDLSKAKVTLSATSYVYNGKTKKPVVTVRLSGKKVAAENYTVAYADGRKAVGEYKVTVKGRKKCGGSKSATFKIVPKATKLVSVKAARRGFTAKWSKQAVQAGGYQVQYSLKRSFKSAAMRTVARAKTTSFKASKLKPGKRYYVRVRVFKKVKGVMCCSSWSPAKSVKTKR